VAGTGEPVGAAGPAPSEPFVEGAVPRRRAGRRPAAPRERPRTRGGALGAIREFVPVVLAALALAILIKSFLVQAFYIPSVSMEPTLHPGDRILVCRVCELFSGVTYGDVVVFADPHPAPAAERDVLDGFVHWLGEGIGVARPAHDDFIKRVAALEGDTWEIADGVLFVNGRRVREPYVAGERDPRDFGPETVPEGMLFVLGDNRAHSGDSRFPPPAGLGYVPEDAVIGEAFVIAWPIGRIGGLR
jgi:signal peptidase I